jgi:hypothetical protein
VGFGWFLEGFISGVLRGGSLGFRVEKGVDGMGALRASGFLRPRSGQALRLRALRFAQDDRV